MNCQLCCFAITEPIKTKLSAKNTFVLHLFVLLFLMNAETHQTSDGFIEIVEVEDCYDSKFNLICRKLDTHIAIMEAFYLPKNETGQEQQKTVGSSCGIPHFEASYLSSAAGTRTRIHEYSNNSESLNIRSPLSHRCSGVNHCTFVLSQDYPPAEIWPRGTMFIKYACVDDARSVKYCNLEVEVGSESTSGSEGFVRSPGYPHYYIGEARCRWLLRAERGQRLRITLLDVALRGYDGPHEKACKDSLTISDGHSGDELLVICDQVEDPVIVDSNSETLDILLRAESREVFPKRGILFHYKSLGCSTPAAPRDGHLAHRSPTAAHFMCDVGFRFADTKLRQRAVRCRPDRTWDAPLPLPACVVQPDPIWEGNVTRILPPAIEVDHPTGKSTMIVDVVIPSFLIAALFIGNAFIIFIIYRYRKRKSEDQDEFSGLAEFNKNGNMVHENGDSLNSV